MKFNAKRVRFLRLATTIIFCLTVSGLALAEAPGSTGTTSNTTGSQSASITACRSQYNALFARLISLGATAQEGCITQTDVDDFAQGIAAALVQRENMASAGCFTIRNYGASWTKSLDDKFQALQSEEAVSCMAAHCEEKRQTVAQYNKNLSRYQCSSVDKIAGYENFLDARTRECSSPDGTASAIQFSVNSAIPSLPERKKSPELLYGAVIGAVECRYAIQECDKESVSCRCFEALDTSKALLDEMSKVTMLNCAGRDNINKMKDLTSAFGLLKGNYLEDARCTPFWSKLAGSPLNDDLVLQTATGVCDESSACIDSLLAFPEKNLTQVAAANCIGQSLKSTFANSKTTFEKVQKCEHHFGQWEHAYFYSLSTKFESASSKCARSFQCLSEIENRKATSERIQLIFWNKCRPSDRKEYEESIAYLGLGMGDCSSYLSVDENDSVQTAVAAADENECAWCGLHGMACCGGGTCEDGLSCESGLCVCPGEGQFKQNGVSVFGPNIAPIHGDCNGTLFVTRDNPTFQGAITNGPRGWNQVTQVCSHYDYLHWEWSPEYGTPVLETTEKNENEQSLYYGFERPEFTYPTTSGNPDTVFAWSHRGAKLNHQNELSVRQIIPPRPGVSGIKSSPVSVALDPDVAVVPVAIVVFYTSEQDKKRLDRLGAQFSATFDHMPTPFAQSTENLPSSGNYWDSNVMGFPPDDIFGACAKPIQFQSVGSWMVPLPSDWSDHTYDTSGLSHWLPSWTDDLYGMVLDAYADASADELARIDAVFGDLQPLLVRIGPTVLDSFIAGHATQTISDRGIDLNSRYLFADENNGTHGAAIEGDTVAHELGHVLGLDHVDVDGNTMVPMVNISAEPSTLLGSQCRTAYTNATSWDKRYEQWLADSN